MLADIRIVKLKLFFIINQLQKKKKEKKYYGKIYKYKYEIICAQIYIFNLIIFILIDLYTE